MEVMHDLNIKYCIDCKAGVETAVKWETVDAPGYSVGKCTHIWACFVQYRGYMFTKFLISYFLRITMKLKPSLADIRRKGLCLSLIFLQRGSDFCLICT